MEFFNRAKAVRLRSYHEKFLIADEDGEAVRQSHDGSSSRALWIVEFVQGNSHLIRLKNINGRYLSASNDPFLLGMTGKKVVQTMAVSEREFSIDWEPRTEGFHVKLRAKGGKFLRANGGMPPWKNSVTHDFPHRSITQDWVLWKVEIVDTLERDSLHCASPASSFSASFSSDFVASCFSSDFAASDHSETEFQFVDRSFSRNTHESLTQNTVELFRKVKVIQLRSHHEKYLVADDDEEEVNQDGNGTIKNARWTVELIEKSNFLRLKSCYGKYLTATNIPFMLGITGKQVLQTLPKRLDSSVEWEPISVGDQFKLKTRYGQYLRANSGLPPWRNHVTHDIPHRSSTQDWILWDIDIVEIRAEFDPASPPAPPLTGSCGVAVSPSDESVSPAAISIASSELKINESHVSASIKNGGRLIHYNVANENGEIEKNEKLCLTFKGSVVEELKTKLEEETGLNDVLVCSRNPLNGKLYPLRLHLPPNHIDMHLIVVPSSRKGASNIANPANPTLH